MTKPIDACLRAIEIAQRVGLVADAVSMEAVRELREGRMPAEAARLADRLLLSPNVVDALLALATTIEGDGEGESTATEMLVRELRGLRERTSDHDVPTNVQACAETTRRPAPMPVPQEVQDAIARSARRVGRYILLEELGHGAMGVVYRAWDPSLARIVALKMLREPGQVLRERFLREGRAMARLRHPGIVQVHDVGEEGGVSYLAMDHVPGRTVREALAGGRIPGIRERAGIVRAVSEAVGFAHAAGIVHRDLKPENILLDAQGRPVVTDFGLARQAGSSMDETLPTLTEEGAVLGTPAYMSPEQAMGEKAVGPTADVFSLGAILYEFITGRAPFDGATLQGLLSRVAEANPVPPRTFRSGLPRDLETICLKALERDPARRYADASALSADLGRWMSGDPVEARPPSWFRRCARLARRHPRATTATSLVTTLLLIATVLWLIPGTLNLHVRPVGALVTIEGRTWTATQAALPIELQAGAYEVVVEAPGHERQVVGVRVQRGRFRDLTVELHHDEGVLEAESDTPGSEIEVDGVAYGSRVRNLSLPTGRHSVRAWCNDYMERETEVDIRRGQTTRIFLSLERGVVWSLRPLPVSGFPYFGVDADGDHVVELACREGADLVLHRLADGAELWRAAVARSLKFHFSGVELIPGRQQLLVSREETTGLVVTCWDPRKTGKDAQVWEFTGPTQSWDHPSVVLLAVLPDQNGDRIREVAVPGRDHAIWILDGATGKSIARHPTPVHADFLTTATSDGEAALLYAGRPTDRSLPAGQGSGVGRVGCVQIGSGRETWGRDLQPGGTATTCDVDGDSHPEVVCCDPGVVTLLDGGSGAVRWEVRLGGAPAVPQVTWTHADQDGVSDAIVVAGGRLSAWSGRGGTRFWEAEGTFATTQLPSAYGGVVVIPEEASISAWDLSTGRERWRLAGRYREVRACDWDGDGRYEWFAGLRGKGIVCIDGSGRILWTVRIPFDVTPSYHLWDVDRDGLSESVVCVDGTMLALIRGPRRLWTRSAAGPLLASPVVLDAEGDGRLEVVQLGPWGEDRSLACLEGATGTMRWSRMEVFPPNRGPGVGDLDRDGRPDLVQAGRPENQGAPFLSVFRTSDGSLLSRWSQEGAKIYSAPLVVDLDQDGTLDAVIQRWDKQDIYAANGTNGNALWTRPVGAYAMGKAAAGDLDGDGTPEVVSPSMDGAVRALRGRDGEPIWTARIEPEGSRAEPTIEDVDGDGLPEVLLVSRRGTLWVLDGKTGLEEASFAGAADPVGRPVVAKAAGGKTLAVAAQGDAGIAAYDVAGETTLWRTRPGIPVIASPAIADFRGDGRLEVVVATANGILAVLDLETGQALWQLGVTQHLIEAAPVVVDLDKDGVLDILVADHGGLLQVIHGRGIGDRSR